MDWVEKRAARQALMRSGIPRFWEYLKSSLDHVVNSYNQYYRGQFVAGYDSRYPETVHVIRDLDKMMGVIDTRTSVAITCDASKSQIVARYQDGTAKTLSFSVSGESNIVLTDGERELDEETASEFLTECVLFPPPTQL